MLSVIVPFYDETIFIRQAVASCLALEDALHEVIIVDDGPLGLERDFFADMPHSSKITILRNRENLGHPGSRNVGMDRATGEFAIYLDADDLLVPESMLEALRFAAETHADITHLPTLSYRPRYGAWERFERDRQLLAKRRSGLTIDDAPELRYTVATWSWLFRRQFLVESGIRFDPEQRRYVDHLFAVGVLQAAKRISSFDQYPHIWRRRDASMSTTPETVEQFHMLINPIDQTNAILLAHYPPESDVFQRDLAFFTARLTGDWQLLRTCIPARHEDAGKAEVLARLAATLRKYQLQAAILSDPILRKIYRRGVARVPFAPVALEQLPDLYRMIAEERWDELAETLQITSPREAGRQSSAGMPTSPALTLWQAYREQLNHAESMEHRLFSEFLLDDLDARCNAGPSAWSTSAAKRLNQWPSTMHGDLAILARRFDSTVLYPPHAGWEACDDLRKRAAALTDAYVLASLDPDTEQEKPLRSEVLEAWRQWELALLGNSFREISAKVLERGAEASRGDANWQAQRTLKSRIRAKVIEPLIGS